MDLFTLFRHRKSQEKGDKMKNPAAQGGAPKRRTLRWLIFGLISILLCLCMVGGIVVFAVYMQIGQSLPSVEALKNYRPPLVTSVYSADGELIAELFNERRYLV